MRFFAEFDIAPHRHPIAYIIGNQREPVLVAPLVQQIRFAIEELLDLLLEQQAGDLLVSIHYCTSVVTPAKSGGPGMLLGSRFRGNDGKDYSAAARWVASSASHGPGKRPRFIMSPAK